MPRKLATEVWSNRPVGRGAASGGGGRRRVRRVREAEETCCREHGMLRWQLAAVRADLADARGAPAEERALLRQLAEAERELYCVNWALDSARSVLAAHVTGPAVPGRKRRG